MAFFNETDLPWYYDLAESFTIADQYFQSTFTETNPNRIHQFSGSNGISVNASIEVLYNLEPDTGINW
jgi:phospholipase C